METKWVGCRISACGGYVQVYLNRIFPESDSKTVDCISSDGNTIAHLSFLVCKNSGINQLLYLV